MGFQKEIENRMKLNNFIENLIGYGATLVLILFVLWLIKILILRINKIKRRKKCQTKIHILI